MSNKDKICSLLGSEVINAAELRSKALSTYPTPDKPEQQPRKPTHNMAHNFTISNHPPSQYQPTSHDHQLNHQHDWSQMGINNPRTHLDQVQFYPVPVQQGDGSLNPSKKAWQQQNYDGLRFTNPGHVPHFLAHISKEMINKDQYHQMISVV